MVSCCKVTKGSSCDWETGISTLMGEITMGEVEKINTMDEEEVRIWVSVWGEIIVEVDGISTWEN